MTDAAYANRGYTVRFWPLQHFAEISAFVIILSMTITTSKYLVLGWLGMFALMVLVYRLEFAKTLLRWWPLLLAPMMAAASFVWSDYPSISARYGIQLLITALLGVFLARTMSPARFLHVLFLAMLVFCALSLASGRTDYGVLVGLVHSKNQMSLFSFFLFFSAFVTLFSPTAPKQLRLLALPGVALGAYLVATTSSATAYLLAATSVVLFCGFYFFRPLKPAGRAGFLIAAALLVSPLLLIVPEINQAIEDFLVNVLHKDPGLTGRDYLWARADDLISRRPLLGYGFQALWLGNSPEGQDILRWAGQLDGRGFSFHNTYRQFGVDTGLIGMGILIATVIAAGVAYVRQYILAPRAATVFFFTLFILSVARSMTEIQIAAFASHTMLFFVILTYAFWKPAPDWGDDDAQAPAHPPGGYVDPAAPAYPVRLSDVEVFRR